MKVWIVTYQNGYDAEEIIDVFSSEEKAKDFIKNSKYEGPFKGGHDSKQLDYEDYEVK